MNVMQITAPRLPSGAVLKRMGSLLDNRPFRSSDWPIVWESFTHTFQATGLLIPAADTLWTLPATAFMLVFGNGQIAATFIYAFVTMAIIGQWGTGLRPITRLFLMIPQFGLAVLTASFTVWLALKHNACCAGIVPATPMSILAEYAPRIGMPLLYLGAVAARIRQ